LYSVRVFRPQFEETRAQRPADKQGVMFLEGRKFEEFARQQGANVLGPEDPTWSAVYVCTNVWNY